MAKFFGSIFDFMETDGMRAAAVFITLGAALVTGILMSLLCSYKSSFSKSFKVTIALLPAAIGLVIIMVNGSLGAGIAVAGAFSLIRFRSVPGTARDICAIIIAMASGLAFGMGYIAYAVIFALVIGGVFVVLSVSRFGTSKDDDAARTVKITIPEDLNYPTVFDEIFLQYTSKFKLVRVKTVNLGSMMRLTYDVCMKDEKQEKEFIDKLRCRNGNLEIAVFLPEPFVAREL